MVSESLANDGAPLAVAELAGQAPSTGVARLWESLPLTSVIALYGLTSSFQNPTISLFLANAVHAGPFLIGLYFVARGAASIVVNQVVGRVSDQFSDRRVIIGLTGAFGVAGALCLAFFRDYALVLAACVIFLSVALAGFGQVFAYAKETALTRGGDYTAYTSALRAVFSAAWVIGPPVGLFLLARFGFGPLYLCTAVLSLGMALIGRWGLRAVADVGPPAAADLGPRRRALPLLPARVWLLLAIIVVLSMVNQVYNIDISLHITKDLGHGPQLVGIMAGVTAGCEIPVMILAGRVADRVGKGRLLGASAVLATLAFCLLPFASSTAALLAMAALNGVWQAVALSMPIVMVQEEAPGGPGESAALYGSAFTSAGLLAGAVTGVTAAAVGYGNVFWVCAGLSAVAAGLTLARGAMPAASRPAARSPAGQPAAG
jgi:MFS transporter, SET family, sugar efflux transporter